MRKILVINELGLAVSGYLLFFFLYIQYSGWRLIKFNSYVIVGKRVSELGGLTRDFWAENGERKTWADAKAIDSVA